MTKRTEAPDSFDLAPMSPSLRALARRGSLQKLKKGVQIITEGDSGDTIFIVLSGRLRAFSVGADDREITYGEYGAGEYVGELGLDGGLRLASVVTLEPTLCALVTHGTLLRHIDDDPAFAIELLAKVIRRARQATVSLRQIALNSVYGRLKALLEGISQLQADGSRLADPAPSHLEMSRMLGCSREMVSRVMKDLEKGRYLEVGRRRVVIPKPLPDKW
jgi:CRP/FNR family cyclic AMP-dependent transcriptional regulator